MRRKSAETAHHAVEINLVGIELRSIDADELSLSADDRAAAAAHARTIDHDRVERDNRLDAEGTRRLGAELHHDRRPDRDDAVGRRGRLAHLLQRNRHNALAAVGAVVRHHDHLVRNGLHLVLHDDEALVAVADDDRHLVAGLLEGLDNRVERRRAEAAAHADDMAEVLDFGRVA